MGRPVEPPAGELAEADAARLLRELLTRMTPPYNENDPEWSSAWRRRAELQRRAIREADRYLDGEAATVHERNPPRGVCEALAAVEALLTDEGLGHLAARCRALVEPNEERSTT